MENPFPPRTPPEFIHYKGDLGRGLAVWRGHESIVIRHEDLTLGDGLRAGDFGISSDTWVFVIRDASHVAVARVRCHVLKGRLLTTPEQARKRVAQIWTTGKPGPQELHAELDFCTSYRTSAESVRRGATGSECSFQVNETCFSGETTILGGDPIVLGLDSVFMQGPPAWWTENDVREHLLAFTDIWEKLEGWFLSQRERSKKAALGLPRQCEHCHGAGTV